MDHSIVCFGETLFDVFPDKELIGGAPLNVASRLQSLGADVRLISRIGNDLKGREIIGFMQERNMSVASIQTDSILSTGTVKVKLNESGSATYSINSPVAWDHIETSPEDLKIVRNSGTFIFGSLVCRNAISRQSLDNLLVHARFKVFDVNLRLPYYSKDLILNLMKQSDLIKLNDEELKMIAEWLGFSELSVSDQLKLLSEQTDTESICLTLGADGAILFAKGEYFRHHGFKIQVADTVGAGDSFLAGLVYKLNSGSTEEDALYFACALGAMVAGKKGGNAIISIDTIEKLKNKLN